MRNGVGGRAVLVAMLLALVCKIGVAQIGPRYVIDARGVDAGAAAAARGPARGSVHLVGKGLALIRFRGLRVLTVDADADAYSAEAVRDWPAADLVLLTPASAGRYAGLAPLAGLRGVPVVLVEPTDGVTVAPVAIREDGPRHYPMRPWDALHLRQGKGKGATWLRVTAVPGRPGTAHVAGFVLELGHRQVSYRLYVGCEGQGDDGIDGLSQRLPGVDLALLRARDGPNLLSLRTTGAAQEESAGAEAAARAGQPAALTADGYPFSAIRR